MPTKLKPQSGSSSKANRNAPGMKPRNSSGPSRPSTGFEPSKTRDEAGGNHATAAEPANYIGDLEKILDQEGVAMGIMHTVGRSLIGVLDTATFLVPTKSSVNPPFIWEDFSRETSY